MRLRRSPQPRTEGAYSALRDNGDSERPVCTRKLCRAEARLRAHRVDARTGSNHKAIFLPVGSQGFRCSADDSLSAACGDSRARARRKAMILERGS